MKLKSEPLSVNSLYYANKRHGLRPKSKDWQRNLFYQLSHYEAGLHGLRSKFNPSKHGYAVSITYVFPHNVLYNQAGTPSSKAQDLSNCDKALIDVLFLPANFSNDLEKGCQNLNLDDKHLFQLSSRKVPGPEYQIWLEISLIFLP